MEKIEELIDGYKKQIEFNTKYIKGEWACEADRISGMKIAVDVLSKLVKDLEQLKQSLQQTKPAPSNDWDQFELEDLLSEFYHEALPSDDMPIGKYARKIIELVTPAPVVVPEFVAEWYEEHKDDLEQTIFDLHVDLYEKNIKERTEFEEWAVFDTNKPIETLIRMKDGYTVEKEPLYYVMMIDKEHDESIGHVLRKYPDGTIGFDVASVDECKKNEHYHLTQKDVENYDERYMAFAVPVEGDK